MSEPGLDPATLAAEDTAARDAALDITRSFLIQAPAGSGKTALLMQRFLALLARAERPEAIVAMTFTRKAAAGLQIHTIDALCASLVRQAPLASRLGAVPGFEEHAMQLYRRAADEALRS